MKVNLKPLLIGCGTGIGLVLAVILVFFGYIAYRGVSHTLNVQSYRASLEVMKKGDFFITSIWGSSSQDVWFGGHDGYLVHWNGQAFQNHSIPVDYDINELWGCGPDSVWAATGGKTVKGRFKKKHEGAILHWDGSSWKEVLLDGFQLGMVRDVDGTSCTDVWFAAWPPYIVDDTPNLIHWDGTKLVPARIFGRIADATQMLDHIAIVTPDHLVTSDAYSFYDVVDGQPTLSRWDNSVNRSSDATFGSRIDAIAIDNNKQAWASTSHSSAVKNTGRLYLRNSEGLWQQFCRTEYPLEDIVVVDDDRLLGLQPAYGGSRIYQIDPKNKTCTPEPRPIRFLTRIFHVGDTLWIGGNEHIIRQRGRRGD